MTKIGRFAMVGVLSLGIGLLTLEATGSTTFAASSDQAKNGGYVVLVPGSLVTDPPITIDATENVGGGTWTRGVEPTINKGKHVYSYYMHRTLRHSSAAIIGSNTRYSPITAPGVESRADAYGWPWQTGYAKWNTY